MRGLSSRARAPHKKKHPAHDAHNKQGTLVSVSRPLGDASPLTGAYWDFFATLPLLLDDDAAPLGIYGWVSGAGWLLWLLGCLPAGWPAGLNGFCARTEC